MTADQKAVEQAGLMLQASREANAATERFARMASLQRAGVKIRLSKLIDAYKHDGHGDAKAVAARLHLHLCNSIIAAVRGEENQEPLP